MGYEIEVERIENGLLHCKDGSTKKIADWVNPSFVKQGTAEITEKEGFVTYIKMKKSDSGKQFTNNPGNSNKNSNYKFDREFEEKKQKYIIRQSSLQRAIEILELSDVKENLVEGAIDIASKLTDWVLSE